MSGVDIPTPKGRTRQHHLHNEEHDSDIPDIPSLNIREKHEDFDFDDLFHNGRGHDKLRDTLDSIGSIDLEESQDGTENDDQTIITEEKIEADTLYPEKSKVNIDDFELLKLIGQGAYGKVYQVRKRDTKEILAMKCLRKDFLVRTHNVSYTKTEKEVLRKVRHPFIVSLHYAFQNESRIYLVMDWINGGQILFHLREQAMFSENLVKFYAAQVILALEHLHSLDIIHRDLKPENILLDAKGNIVLTDFGFAKESITDQERANTFCGTIEYMAPEMVKGVPYGKSVDWWSVGILIIDMLTGDPPFRSKDQAVLQKKILTEKIKLPQYLTSEAHSIIRGLLNRDEKKRLGSNGAREIKNHPFFKGVHWKKLENGEILPPFRPAVNDALDTSCFDTEFTEQPITESPALGFTLSQSQEKLFQGFSYVRSFSEEYRLHRALSSSGEGIHSISRTHSTESYTST